MSVEDSDSNSLPEDTGGPSAEEIEQRLDRLWGELPTATTSPFSTPVGTTVGRYTIERTIGRGAFGIVYKARDEQTGRSVALKVPRPEVLMDNEMLSRFETEAVATASLDHPGIVPLYEAEMSGATPFLASAYCAGPNLQQWLDETTDLVDASVASQFVASVAAAVHYAHQQGVIHRDLKPSNILLSPNHKGQPDEKFDDRGTPLTAFEPKLTDFGLARLSRRLHETQSSMVLGTPLYMSPEQAESRNDDIGAASDIFGLGAILYRLLTGKAPFEASNYPQVLMKLRDGEVAAMSDVRPDVDSDLETICLKCLRYDENERYATAEELAMDLQRYLRGEPIHARPAGLIHKFRKWSTRSSRVSEAMLTVIATVCVRVTTAFIGLVLLMLLGETAVTRDELQEGFLLHICVTTPVELWTIWAARRHSKRRLASGFYWLALMLSLALMSFSFLASFGIVYGSLWHQRMPGARTVSFLVVGLLFAVQAVCWYVGDWNRVDGHVQEIGRTTLKRTLVAASLGLIVLVSSLHFRLDDNSPGFVGPATSIEFDGVGDFAELSDVGFTESQPFTLEAWAYPSRPQRGTIVSYGPASIEAVATGTDAARIRVAIHISRDDIYLVATENSVPAGQWAHVAVIYDGSCVEVWVNGRREQQAVSLYRSINDSALPTTIVAPLILKDHWPGSPLRIGAQQSGRYHFAGRIGEVRVTNAVVYRGDFVPVPLLSVAEETMFLFHAKGDVDTIKDEVTGREARFYRNGER